MEPFLKTIARKICEQQDVKNLDKVTVVFNNRRPFLYMRSYLNELIPHTHFEPRMIGFDDMIVQLGDLEITKNEFLLFELFDVHRKRGTGYKSSFEEFVSTADIIISDFNEIDRYMVDADSIYTNLADIKEIDNWNVEAWKDGESEKKSRYLEFYRNLKYYYSDFRKRLVDKGMAYSGMAYRKVAEHIGELLDSHDVGPTYFVGFNALSEAEKIIIKEYQRRGLGFFEPDGDPYYFNDANQEAGHFLRLHKEEGLFPQDIQFPEHFASDDKKIHIVQSPDSVTQARFAADLINSLKGDEKEEKAIEKFKREMANTAIVLADESLLQAVVNILPVKEVNITMGLPFVSSNAHALASSVFSLYRRSRDHGGSPRYFHSDILDIMRNPLMGRIIADKNFANDLDDFLQDNNMVSVDMGILQTEKPEMWKVLDSTGLFAPLCDNIDITHRISDLAERILTDEHNTDSRVRSSVASLKEMMDYILGLYEEYSEAINSLSVLEKIYLRTAKRHTISFIGEPIGTLQVTGVLETRNLNYDRVILLSANEGVIPSSRNDNSLIPYNLKRGKHMPTYKEKDSVYAYNFYHLIQHAKETYIVYSTDTNGAGKGAPSRFLLQVESELAPKYGIGISRQRLEMPNRMVGDITKSVVAKTPDIIDKLKKKRYSPSSLAQYRQCPLRFYYEGVLHVEETEDLTDEWDAAQFGNLVHSYLECLYNAKFLDKPLQKENLKNELVGLESKVEAHISKEYKYTTITEGVNHINCLAITDQIKKCLENEIKVLDEGHTVVPKYMEYKYVEKDPSSDKLPPIKIEVDGVERLFRCTADRIDLFDGTLRITDYKTGNVDKGSLAVDEINNEIGEKPFQVLFYAWCYKKVQESLAKAKEREIPFKARLGIYALKKGEYVPFKVNGKEEVSDEEIKAFEDLMCALFKELFDPSIPFSPVEKVVDACKYCKVKNICEKGDKTTVDDDEES
ncbi:MAG: PD-(D/E)XK nuclease family protein [Bacteroidales bacterium]|nr:PD-(D/E)XK nuclease family protein [Bacteroidales bacterium]